MDTLEVYEEVTKNLAALNATRETLETVVREDHEMHVIFQSAEKNAEPVDVFLTAPRAVINVTLEAFITAKIENKAGFGIVAKVLEYAGAGDGKDTFTVYHCKKGEQDAVKNGELVTSISRADIVKRADMGTQILSLIQASADLAPMLVNVARTATEAKVPTHSAGWTI